MFKDYYQILRISSTASKEEIKRAYRQLSLKWHPDRNVGYDVKEIMQDINEAYKVLFNEETRARYDIEYHLFIHKKIKSQIKVWNNTMYSWNYDYDVKDEKLKEDINASRVYAKNIVDDFFKSLKETSRNAAKGAWEGAYPYIIAAIILAIIFSLISIGMSLQYR